MLEKYSNEYFKQEFQCGFEPEEWEYKYNCGDCRFFSARGCTTSFIEAKYGNSKTPACMEFERKIIE